jgi:V8-like Glu-specific endopeptidase
VAEPGAQAMVRQSVLGGVAVPGAQAMARQPVLGGVAVPGAQAMVRQSVLGGVAAPGAQVMARHPEESAAAESGAQSLARGGVAEPGAQAMARQFVVGGVPEPGHAAVGAIVPVSPYCGDPEEAAPVTCTGTLVAPRVVLTAAHCVENADAPQVLSVVFAEETGRAPGTARVRTIDGRLHPEWRAGEHDIGVLILAEDAPVTPVSLRGATLPADTVGRTVRVVGFGLDDDGRRGHRRSGTARVAAVGEGAFTVERAPGMSCGGDSGGPVFLEDALIGVTAFGDLACTTGTNTRVDAHAAFLQHILDDVSRAPPMRAPADPEVDACASRCEHHGDCPRGMACVAQPGDGKRCAVAGLEAGRFGDPCTGPDGAHPCVKAGETCRLWLPCTEAPEGGAGCAAGGSGGVGLGLLLLALSPGMRRRHI